MADTELATARYPSVVASLLVNRPHEMRESGAFIAWSSVQGAHLSLTALGVLAVLRADARPADITLDDLVAGLCEGRPDRPDEVRLAIRELWHEGYINRPESHRG